MMTEVEKMASLSILAGAAKRAKEHPGDTLELSSSEFLAIWHLLFDHEKQLHNLVDDKK